MSAADLDALEHRVRERFVAKSAERVSDWNGIYDGFDASSWLQTSPLSPLLPSVPVVQFPREQWVSYPARRTLVLLTVDRLLDLDELSDEQWVKVCLLMEYGGKTRLV